LIVDDDAIFLGFFLLSNNQLNSVNTYFPFVALILSLIVPYLWKVENSAIVLTFSHEIIEFHSIIVNYLFSSFRFNFQYWLILSEGQFSPSHVSLILLLLRARYYPS